MNFWTEEKILSFHNGDFPVRKSLGLEFQAQVDEVRNQLRRENPSGKWVVQCCWTPKSCWGKIYHNEEVVVKIPRPFVFQGEIFNSPQEFEKQILMNFQLWKERIFFQDPHFLGRIFLQSELPALWRRIVENLSNEDIERILPTPTEEYLYRVIGTEGLLGGEGNETGFWTPSLERARTIYSSVESAAEENGRLLPNLTILVTAREQGVIDQRTGILWKVNHNPEFDEEEVFLVSVGETWEISL